MSDYHVISQERHGRKFWRKTDSYSFSAQDSLCALVEEELPQAALSLPIAFFANGEHFVPVAVQGLAAGRNLLVTTEGRWLSPYIPVAYRSYPFRIADAGNGQGTLCFDEASGLLDDKEGEAFFNSDGTPAQGMQAIFDFLNRIESSRLLIVNISNVLQQHGLIQPWPLTVPGEQGEQKIEGLYCIDEDALRVLGPEALAQVRDAGGLTVAYCQLLSMHHLSKLTALAKAHADADKSRQAQAAMTASETFSFGNL